MALGPNTGSRCVLTSALTSVLKGVEVHGHSTSLYSPSLTVCLTGTRQFLNQNGKPKLQEIGLVAIAAS